jgi:TPR repeat protein
MLDSGSDLGFETGEAYGWYLKAAERGHAMAQFALGLRHDSGQGVAQDYDAAHYWYLCAARQGHARAQFNVGLMQLAGQGAHADLVEAALWLQRAGQAGIEAAARYARRAAERMNPDQRAQFESQADLAPAARIGAGS